MSVWLWKLKEALGNHRYQIKDLDYKQRILSNPVLQNYWTSSRFFVLVNNTATWKNELVLGDYEEMTGYGEEEILSSKFLFQFTDQACLPFLLKAAKTGMKYLLEQRSDERSDIMVSYYYPAKEKEGRRLIIGHDSFPLEFDHKHVPFIFCNVLSDLSHLGISKYPHARLVHHSKKVYISFDDTDAELSILKPDFTTREKTIIHLILQGLNSRAIAKTLFISYETVRTHRRNILRKVDLHSVTDLVQSIYQNRIML